MATDGLTREAVMQSALKGVGGGGGSSEPISQLSAQLQQLQTVGQAQTQAVQTNTTAVNQNTTQIGQSGPSTASGGVSSAQSVLGLGLGLSPLITGLLSLFGGGGGGQPAPLTRFALPQAVGENAGVSEGAPTSPFGVDYAAGGAPRAGGTGGQQITVQVQAMDSQSFLDRSQDIAAAVRQAMLESTVLNDVIREV